MHTGPTEDILATTLIHTGYTLGTEMDTVREWPLNNELCTFHTPMDDVL